MTYEIFEFRFLWITRYEIIKFETRFDTKKLKLDKYEYTKNQCIKGQSAVLILLGHCIVIFVLVQAIVYSRVVSD